MPFRRLPFSLLLLSCHHHAIARQLRTAGLLALARTVVCHQSTLAVGVPPSPGIALALFNSKFTPTPLRARPVPRF